MESKRCCFILPLFGQGLGYLIFKYKTKTLASLWIQLIVALSKNLSLSHAPRKWRKRIELQNRVGPRRRRSSGTCISIIFNTSIPPVYLLLVYPVIGQLWQFTSTLTSIIWLRTRSRKNMSSRWNPHTPYLLTPWHLTFWHKKRFFRKWADWGIWKLRCSQTLPSSLLVVSL